MFNAKYIVSYIDEDFENRAICFWNYFADNHHKIEQMITEHQRDFINQFENELKKIFINYQKPLRFCFKKNDDNFVLFFYYGHSSYLMTLFDKLLEINNYKFEKWRFLSQK